MKIEEVIGEVSTIGISGHVRPDGDCIGSCMGMYLYLKKCDIIFIKDAIRNTPKHKTKDFYVCHSACR